MRGVFLCAQSYIRHRERRPVPDGRFITFSSVAAQLGGYRSNASYIAAKSAVLGFTKAMAREVSHMDITVNSVSPGLRSEEHTSELQSLMRLSYAVFCLKKKKTISNKRKDNPYSKQQVKDRSIYPMIQ